MSLDSIKVTLKLLHVVLEEDSISRLQFQQWNYNHRHMSKDYRVT